MLLLAYKKKSQLLPQLKTERQNIIRKIRLCGGEKKAST